MPENTATPSTIVLTPDEHRAIAKVDGRPRVSPSQISAQEGGDLLMAALDSPALIRDREIIMNHQIVGGIWLTLWRNATPRGDLYRVIAGGLGGKPTYAGLYFLDADEALLAYAGHVRTLAEDRAAERATAD
ncbi:hypothetical protein [Nocardioides sp. KR10-350]|uniref:hypothetical protein n=1 Tax=Nocardioides cheoyonin TaxID=3156615 RepID=UPI0032B321D5